MAKRRTKKQKIKKQKRVEKKSSEEFSYSIPDAKDLNERGEKIKLKTSDRLSASYSTVIAETRFSIFVSISIFIVYLLIYFLA